MLRCSVQNLTELCLLLPDFIFCFLALGDIHNGPDKLYELARLVQDGMAYSVEMLDPSIGKNNAVVRFIIGFLDFGSFKELPNALLVVGMISAKPKFCRRRILIRLDAAYSKHFRRDYDCPR